MTRTLTGPATWFYKLVFAPFWMLIFGTGTLGLFAAGGRDGAGRPIPAALPWVVLAAWVIGSASMRSLLTLKRVRLGDGVLYVAGLLGREVAVPLGAVAEVREAPGARLPLVSVEFREPTAAGRRVRFLPRRRPLGEALGASRLDARLRPLPHPEAERLRAAVAAATDSPAGDRAPAG